MIGRRLAAALGVVFAGLLSGATGPYTARLTAVDLRHIRTIAVIAATGSSFQFERVRDTAFEWLGPPDSHFLETSDWGLDDMIARKVTAALAKRFTIKPIAFIPANFASWNAGVLKRASLDLNGDPAIDAYVFVLRDWRPDEIGYSVHDLGGLGLYRRDGTTNRPKFGMFACYRIVMVDALTGDIIASRAALTRKLALPWMAIDPSRWPKSQNDLGQSEVTALISDESRLIEESLLPTLERMNLAG